MSLGRREQLVLLLLALAVVFGLGAKYALHRQTPISEPAVEEREKPLEVSVHVAGAVYHPGVYRLRAGSRVIDAVQKAGGACRDANVDVLNLAQILEDGQKVLVPEKVQAGETPAPNPFASTPGVSAVTGGNTVSGTLININTADVRTLESLPGIGPALAQRIVEYRDANGPFTSPDDLVNVPGIGEKKLAQLRDCVCVQ
ncbi:MAG: ComEA family DNA-binding protein [Ammonifex sp.]|jgi:competence protein ComEA|nr:MAG: ComEA family DNA-binding protein [Ammonifex sp.]